MASERVYRSMILLGQAAFSAVRLRREVHDAGRLDVQGGAVLAITHFSYLDFALAEWTLWRQNRRMIRFLATARAFEHPIAGRLLRAMKHVPVERTAGGPSYAAAVRRLRAGELIGVFPEGQVYRSEVGPLKTGAVRMAMEAGVPLIPVAIWGGQAILTKGTAFSPRRAWRAKVVIMVGDPCHLRPGTDPRLATEQLRSTLEALIEQARPDQNEPPDPPRSPPSTRQRGSSNAQSW